MTRTGAAGRPDLDDHAHTLIDWMQERQREISIVLLVCTVVVVSGWLYTRWRGARAEGAAKELAVAGEAVRAGNLPLARSELKKVITRFDGTPAASQAAMLLGQVLFEDGKYPEGIKELEPVAASGDKLMAAGAENLIGAGYEQLSKYDEAAAHYRKAAGLALYPAERDNYLANAARVLSVSGKTAEARTLWESLANDQSSELAAEARVRLGELAAKG